MIRRLNKNHKHYLSDVAITAHQVKKIRNPDFYMTLNNQRIYVNDGKTLREMLKESKIALIHDAYEEVKGIILVWTSIGGNTERNYVKVSAVDTDSVDDLLTVLGWHFNQDLYVKLSKTSPYLDVFKSKGFRFCGGRGKQVLLRRNKMKHDEVKWRENNGSIRK